MSNRITDNPNISWSIGDNHDLPIANKPSSQAEPQTALPNFAPGAESKLFETNNNAQLLRREVAAKYVQTTSSASGAAKNTDLEQRADKLAKVFAGGGKRTFESVKPLVGGLSTADAKELRQIYQQQTGRDILRDATNYLFMEDRLRAFQVLAPERIHEQAEPQAAGSGGNGIKMNPPGKEVLEGAQVEYTLDLSGEIGGNRAVKHLIRRDNADVEESGANFTADYRPDEFQKDKTYLIAFEVRYNDGLPEFYRTCLQLIEQSFLLR